MKTMERGTGETVQAAGGRPWRRAVRIAATTAAVCAVVLAVGMAGSDDGGDVVVQPRGSQAEPPGVSVTDAPATTVARPPTAQAPSPQEPLSERSRVGLQGIGPVAFGMTLAEASTAAGMPIEIRRSPVSSAACTDAVAADGPAGLIFLVVDGRVARVDVGATGPDRSHPITTLSGVGVGSTEAEVQQAYPGRIQTAPNQYVGHRGFRTLTYTPEDPALAQYGLVFETDGERVISFRAGLAGPVTWIERCS